MKNFKKIRTTLFFGAYLIISINLILPISAQAVDVNFSPQVGIPKTEFEKGTPIKIGDVTENSATGETVMQSDLLARYISAFYGWGLSIVGVISVLMLMAAGVIWLTSAGDSGKITNAKKMVEGSLLGGALLISSWFLLNTINPNLTKLPAIETVIIDKVITGCCETSDKAEMVTGNICETKKGKFYEDKIANTKGQCEDLLCCTVKMENVGRSYSYCYTSNKENCPDGTTSNKKCSELSTCTTDPGFILNCNGIKNGLMPVMIKINGVDYSKKTDRDFITEEYYYCYSNLGYGYQGKIGEPCGEEPYSKCDADEKQNNQRCKGGSGGRGCDDSTCCQFNADGTRINK